jgi:GntR family transcriptional regulator/MocR family aminotransferase
MLPFKTLISIHRKRIPSVYLQIANRLTELIRNGILKPGTRLPSTRALAGLLQVHRKTVVAAYEELNAQDWIESIPRKGVIVSKHLPEIKPRTFKSLEKSSGYPEKAAFSFRKINSFPIRPAKPADHRLIINDGFPDSRIAPIDTLLKEYRLLFHKQSVQRRVMFGDESGSQNLRSAIARFLTESRGLNITEANILVTHGAQMAISLASNSILKPGSIALVAEPNYRIANMIFEHSGAKLLRVSVDEHGIDVDAIEKICRKKKPDLLYVIPHHHHPTTVTLSAERRMKLLHLIRKYRFAVIEDDYDYDFHYSSSPILPLASADHDGLVIYIGSLAKTSLLTCGSVIWLALKILYMLPHSRES